MTELERTGHEHLDIGELVRLHDGELHGEREVAAARALEGCPECRGRFDAFTEQSRMATEALKAADPARPRLTRRHRPDAGRPVSRPIWRIAAGVVLAVGIGGIAASPIRAWVAERWTAIWQPAPAAIDPSVPSEPAPAAIEPEDPSSNTATIGFSFSGDSLVVRLASRQRGGLVVIASSPTAGVSAEIIDGGAETVGLVPMGLVVRNDVDSEATYRVSVPSTVRVVTVAVGDEPVAVIAWNGGRVEGETVELSLAR